MADHHRAESSPVDRDQQTALSSRHMSEATGDRSRLNAEGRVVWFARRPAVMSSTPAAETGDSFDEMPLLLTVPEAARVLRIGRSLAYQLAHRYEVSGGCEGLPVVRLASCLRVPRGALIELVTKGSVVRLADHGAR